MRFIYPVIIFIFNFFVPLLYGQNSSKVDTTKSTLESVQEKAEGITKLISASDILLIIFILLITYYLIKFFSILFDILAKNYSRRRLFIMKLLPVIRISLWLLSFYVIVFGVLRPTKESIIAFSATAGIAIGFAAQDVLKNVFGGIVILIDRPFQVGDLIDIDVHHGEVVNIGLRSTRILTKDDSIISIPNSEVVNKAVSNANTGALDCMVVTTMFLPALVDTTLVKKIAYESAATSPYLYFQKPIIVTVLDDFKETFLTKVLIKAYVYDHRLEKSFSTDVTERAKAEFIKRKLIPDEIVLGLNVTEEKKFLTGNNPDKI